MQKFMKAVEPRGDARAEWEFLHELVYESPARMDSRRIEGLFNQMAGNCRRSRLDLGGLGGHGRDGANDLK